LIAAIVYPAIDPVAIHIGPLAIRWYALAYIAGLLIGWRYCRRLAQRPPRAATALQIDDFLFWATIAVIVGGRLGYVLFYQPGYYFAQPLQILEVWRGGMSFHGGLLGVIVAAIFFARYHRIPILELGDLISAVAPIGLFFGRIANFVNGELWGRPTEVPWAVIFPGGGPVGRHPSQLYEAGLEGLVLFGILWVLITRAHALERPGLITGVFLAGYGLARAFVEMFRQPDAYLGFLIGGLTMGQLLSLPVLAAGLYLIARALRPAR